MKTPLNGTGKTYAHFSSMGIALNKVDFQFFLKFPMKLVFSKDNINFVIIEQLVEIISCFCNAVRTLIKEATVGLVQRAVSRKRGRNSSDTLCRTVAFGSRPSRCDTPRLREATTTLN
jgi:hypothetical protein